MNASGRLMTYSRVEFSAKSGVLQWGQTRLIDEMWQSATRKRSQQWWGGVLGEVARGVLGNPTKGQGSKSSSCDDRARFCQAPADTDS